MFCHNWSKFDLTQFEDKAPSTTCTVSVIGMAYFLGLLIHHTQFQLTEYWPFMFTFSI